jgi:hypothetical protein
VWVRHKVVDATYLETSVPATHTQAFTLDLVASTVESLSLVLQCLAEAEHLAGLFRALEACGALLRLDPAVEPTMFRGAIVRLSSRVSNRSSGSSVRDGCVASTPTGSCSTRVRSRPTAAPSTSTARPTGCGRRHLGPIFEVGRITPQSLMGGFTTFNAAMVGFIEAARDGDADKTRLCPPTAYPTASIRLDQCVRGRLSSDHPDA